MNTDTIAQARAQARAAAQDRMARALSIDVTTALATGVSVIAEGSYMLDGKHLPIGWRVDPFGIIHVHANHSRGSFARQDQAIAFFMVRLDQAVGRDSA